MIKKELLKKIFKPTEFGSISILTPDQEVFEFQGSQPGPQATIHLKAWSVLDAIAFHHDIGFFETYAEELWDTDSLENLCDFVFQNEKAFHKADIGVMDGLLFWAQSSKVTFSSKKPLSEYSLTFDYELPQEAQDKSVLLLGKNNAHLENIPNVTIYSHGVEYQPFDHIIIYDPFFYVKDADIFLKKMQSLLKPEGKMLWRTLVFGDNILAQGKFLSKLVFPGFWTPKSDDLKAKINKNFNIEDQKNILYPNIDMNDRLLSVFNAIVIALTQNKKLDYKEFVLTPKN